MKTLAQLSACLLAACIEFPDLPKASLIEGPRVLAVVAEPPEITPGHALSVSVLVAQAEDFEVEYRVCGALDGLFGGSQYGEEDQDDCAGSTALLSGRGERGPEGRWTIPAEAIDLVWKNRDLAEQVLGSALPPETLAQIRSSVGLPVMLEATVTTGGKRLRAVKRVVLSENSDPNRNPPAPSFEFGGQLVQADERTPWSCVSAGGNALIARARREIELAPAVSDGSEPWIDRYRVIDAQGHVQERSERAYYSWFSTGGSFEQQITKAPLRNQLWTTPSAPEQQRLWLVIRDGHGGTSACGVDVTVRP